MSKLPQITLAFWVMDLLTKTPANGGLGFGTIGSSAVLMSILVVLVVWTRKKHLD